MKVFTIGLCTLISALTFAHPKIWATTPNDDDRDNVDSRAGAQIAQLYALQADFHDAATVRDPVNGDSDAVIEQRSKQMLSLWTDDPWFLLAAGTPLDGYYKGKGEPDHPFTCPAPSDDPTGTWTFTHAQDANDGIQTTVRVYVIRNVNDRNLNVSWAQDIASNILTVAGVKIKWPVGEPKRRQQGMPIVINITSDTPKTFVPGALACAQVFEGVHIRVFWDRVRNAVNGANRPGTFLLAHVMAHEITHIMEGIDRHSEVGLMKASWTQTEIEQMTVRQLSLAPEDVQLIHNGLLKRAPQQVHGHATCG